MKKRILSFLLSVCLLLPFCFVCVPSAAADAENVSLHVEDGLVMSFDAYDPKNGTVDLTAGTWQSENGKTARLIGAWQAAERGIYYTKSSPESAGNAPQSGIDLGIENLPEDFTVEMVLTPHGLTNGGEKVTFSTPYGLSYSYGFAFGAFKGYVYPGRRADGVPSPTSDPRYCTWQTMWYYAGEGFNYSWLLDDYSFNTYMDQPLSYAVTGDLSSSSASYRIYANGASVGGVNVDSSKFVANSASDGMFHLLASFPATVYTVRVYNRELTPEERARNHFADLVEYLGVDVAERFLQLPAAMQDAVCAKFASSSFTEEGLAERILAEVPVLSEEDLLVEGLLSYQGVSLRRENGDGLRHLFRVDREALSRVEENYEVAIGAMIARAGEGYYTFDSLQLSFEDGSFKSPEKSAMFTVYSSSALAEVNGRFTEEGGDEFAVTVMYGDTPRDESYGADIVAVGYVILVKDGTAKIYYTGGASAAYGENPSFEDVARGNYMLNKNNEQALTEYTDMLQAEMKDYYLRLANTPVLVCGKDSPLPGGEKAVWVEYLPEHDPWKNDPDADKAAIRAIYVYYPMAEDPSTLSDEEMRAMGVVRSFGYIGVPEKHMAGAGIVCVHGGAGHGYAKYALEAMKNGYAAIAIDTEGCYNTTGTGNYSEAEAAYQVDVLGHMKKDGFATEEKELEAQWLYWAIGDAILSNSVLRSLDEVDEDLVGLTGISWGGLITSTTVCYDMRFAFCVPVYIAFHMSESTSASVGNLPSRPLAQSLWQDASLLSASTVPVLMLASDRDHFASINTNMATWHDLKDGSIIIKPAYGHSQGAGAAPSEIYRYGYYMLGLGYGFITAEREPTKEDGRSYKLALDIPSDLRNVTVTLYYRTEPIGKYDQSTRPEWKMKALSVVDGEVNVEIPADACMYYISFCGISDDVADIKENTPYSDGFAKGTVYSSTGVVWFD